MFSMARAPNEIGIHQVLQQLRGTSTCECWSALAKAGQPDLMASGARAWGNGNAPLRRRKKKNIYMKRLGQACKAIFRHFWIPRSEYNAEPDLA